MRKSILSFLMLLCITLPATSKADAWETHKLDYEDGIIFAVPGDINIYHRNMSSDDPAIDAMGIPYDQILMFMDAYNGIALGANDTADSLLLLGVYDSDSGVSYVGLSESEKQGIMSVIDNDVSILNSHPENGTSVLDYGSYETERAFYVYMNTLVTANGFSFQQTGYTTVIDGNQYIIMFMSNESLSSDESLKNQHAIVDTFIFL